MTVDRNQGDSESVRVDSADPAAPTGPEIVRKPYTQPRLRRLGSVRELTLGSSGVFVEAIGRRNM